MKPQIGDLILSKNSIEFYARIVHIDRSKITVRVMTPDGEQYPEISIFDFKEKVGDYWILPNWTIPVRLD